MGCTRNLLKISAESVFAVVLIVTLALPSRAWAAFASQFSFSVGEQYNDNIFFEKKKEHDFVTVITPTLHLYYAPTGQGAPTANLNISPTGLIYARHSDLNDFGFTDTSAVTGGYTFFYSPRLTFNFSESFQRQGDTRLPSGLTGFQTPLTPTAPPPVGAPIPQDSSQNLKDFISQGGQLTNNFSFQGSFLYRPDISFTAGYSNVFTKFLQVGGTDWSQNFSVRGIYNWKQEHNLHVGYTVTQNNSRNGDNGMVHNFDFGDDYFTNRVYNIQLTPTLSLAASTGLSINTSNSGPRVANNSAITVTKLWETASFAAGFRKGLTPSFGISGISDTTTFFANFNIQLAERISANAGFDYSLYDTDDVNFKTMQVSMGLQYLITTWLSSSLSSSFRSIDSGAGASRTDLLRRGTVDGTSVFLNFTVSFDLWPNQGLTRTLSSAALAPVLRTPFPTVAPASTQPQP
jgi:hypothetical protein